MESKKSKPSSGGHWSIEEFRRNAHRVADLIVDYYQNEKVGSVRSSVSPGWLRQVLPSEAPREGESFDAIIKDVQNVIFPGMTHWQNPQFYAYFPAGASPPSIVGEWLGSSFGVAAFSWIASPAVTELESLTMDWLAKAIGLSTAFLSTSTGVGVIQPWASDSTLVATVAARTRTLEKNTHLDRATVFSRLVAYASEHAHASVQKAIKVLGLEDKQFKKIPGDEFCALDIKILKETIAADKKAGLIPFFVCGTFGTTSTAAVDPCEQIGELCAAEGIYFHIDAAYAGASLICPEYRYLMGKGLEKADSFCFNGHKWLLILPESSFFFSRDRALIRRSLSITPGAYLKNAATESGAVIDFHDLQLPFGRRFKSMKLWFTMRTYGISGLQQYIRHSVYLADQVFRFVSEDPRFEIHHPCNFALVCFFIRDPAYWKFKNRDGKTPEPSLTLSELNALSEKLQEEVNKSGYAMVTGSMIKGRHIQRIATGNWTQTLEHVKEFWKFFSSCTDRVLGKVPERVKTLSKL